MKTEPPRPANAGPPRSGRRVGRGFLLRTTHSACLRQRPVGRWIQSYGGRVAPLDLPVLIPRVKKRSSPRDPRGVVRETIPSTANKGRCRAGRVASLVFDNRLFLRVRVSKTASPRDGGDAGGLCRPKPSAAVRCQTSLPRICRARFSASGGRRPLSNEVRTTPRTANRETGASLASRGLRLMLRLFSPDGENRSPRWGRLRDTTTDDNSARGGAVGLRSASGR